MNSGKTLTARRAAAFRRNRRAVWSLRIFLVFFILSMGAEFIANDRPLLIRFRSELYAPVFFDYTERDFGGDFEAAADYRDPYIKEIIQAEGWMLWPPVPFADATINYGVSDRLPAPPSSENWLGTDDQGRDILARLLYGFRISVLFGMTLTGISVIIGTIAAALQGFYGGWVDMAGQRFMEIWSGVPKLYLLIILSSVVQMGFWSLLGITLLFSWMGIVHVVRAEFLRCRNLDYVRAARALGLSDSRIMFRHILPNATVAALTMLPFMLGGSITTLTSLDFLGFGMPPGSPSLGELVTQGKNNLHAPWIGLSAFFVLATVLTLLVFVGEGLRDAMDPDRKG